MIWIWALAGFILTALLLRKKDVRWYHYIWALLPIDQYGVQIGGAIIKPYMMFAIPLLFYARSKKSLKINSKQLLMFFFICIAFFLSDIANGFIMSSVFQRLYFVIIMVESWLYLNCLSDAGESTQIENAIASSVVGFGCVSIFAEMAFKFNINLPGVVSDTSKSGALIKLYSTMQDTNLIQTYRLHGFESDPNSFSILFILGFTIAIYNLIVKRRKLKRVLVLLCISTLCIVWSNSRGAILTCLVISFILILKNMFNKKGNVFLKGLVLLGLLFTVVVIVVEPQWLIAMAMRLVGNTGRSTLTGQFGRLTIWKENIGNMLEINPLFGVGANQSYLYSSISRACHNTWIEWLCSSGILIGPLAVIAFMRPLKYVFISNKDYSGSETPREVILLMYTAVFVMLISLDYFANIYLLFLFVLSNAMNARKTWITQSNSIKCQIDSKDGKYYE